MISLAIYHHLPYPLKVIAASARGYYLNYWRYNSQTEPLVEEALDRESWPLVKIQAWQEERLSEMLVFSASHIPYYQDHWLARRRHGDRSSWQVLSNWPILTKNIVREKPLAFLAVGQHKNHLFLEHTSGTTGTPLTLYQDRNTLVQWYALFEARWRRWNDVDRKTPWAILGGQLVIPFSSSTPPFWVWNQAFHQLYLSSYHLSLKNIQAYAQAIQSHGIEYLYGYPSSMAALANFAREASLQLPTLKVVLSNAEPLLEYQKVVIQDAFGCQVRNTYGMSEFVCGASECQSGHLHLWPEVGILECLSEDSDNVSEDGMAGRLVATGLINRAMPLIRYEIGDRGQLNGFNCTCGRQMQILSEVEGRMDDVILTPDGRKIGRLDPVFKADLAIREAQIIQETPSRIIVNLVTTNGFGNRHHMALKERIQNRLGNMEIEFCFLESIPRGPNGKFRAVISKINRSSNGPNPVD